MREIVRSVETMSSLPPVITSFTFGDNVEKIPEGICEDMEKLTSVTIPESVTSIGKEAFKNCTELTSVVWKARKCANFSNSAYSPQFNTCPNITSFTFGENVEKIPAYLCSGITQISEISIPESVTYMGRDAFKECPGNNFGKMECSYLRRLHQR